MNAHLTTTSAGWSGREFPREIAAPVAAKMLCNFGGAPPIYILFEIGPLSTDPLPKTVCDGGEKSEWSNTGIMHERESNDEGGMHGTPIMDGGPTGYNSQCTGLTSFRNRGCALGDYLVPQKSLPCSVEGLEDRPPPADFG